MKEIAEISEAHAASWKLPAVDPRAAHAAAQAATQAPQARKDHRGDAR